MAFYCWLIVSKPICSCWGLGKLRRFDNFKTGVAFQVISSSHCPVLKETGPWSQMVEFMKGRHFPWNCRAGQNSMIIRVDGTLAPCFPMYLRRTTTGV